ncbi:hypothetical protein LPB03_02260 [Polaribacter vadi]|uniref:Uncharacterized protein n=1 Tax=Polaribacter vadi TaxID=1774273 RepID=A0A1B8U242_9FLAO|nr:hypothetical protein [Polaribacter vadi]AOW16360.1 hypothetical protein LPB03_02260 [Polaribacter vadi]OBY65940.1 hypothetical protein LPB3_02820 [Polaribacter vadi]
MGKDEKSINKKSVNKDGVTENGIGAQNIETREKKMLEFYGKDILIGKDIDEVKKISESHESLQSRLLNKIMK